MREEGAAEVGGVMHCFTETWDVAAAAIDLGFYISMSGIVTFKNARDLHDVARRVPLDRLLIETDSPYLAPVPFRGKTNEPAFVAHVAARVAELRGTTVDEIGDATTAQLLSPVPAPRGRMTRRLQCDRHRRAACRSCRSGRHAACDDADEKTCSRPSSIDDLRDVRRLLTGSGRRPEDRLDARGDTLLIAAIRDERDARGRLSAGRSRRPTSRRRTRSNETALMIAAYRKSARLVEKLLAHDAEVNRVGWTALHYAASVGARDIVALLLDHAAYIDAESPNRTTPLMMAARGGFDELCRQLVDGRRRSDAGERKGPDGVRLRQARRRPHRSPMARRAGGRVACKIRDVTGCRAGLAKLSVGRD